MTNIISQTQTIRLYIPRILPVHCKLVLPYHRQRRLQCTSQATFQCLGAAAAASAVQVPSWSEGYDNSNVGGLIFRMMLPVDSPNKEITGFAKFLTVLMSLSVTSNMAITFYSFSLNMQTIHRWLAFIPRYLWSVVVTAV